MLLGYQPEATIPQPRQGLRRCPCLHARPGCWGMRRPGAGLGQCGHGLGSALLASRRCWLRCISRFWVDKGATCRKHRNNMSFFVLRNQVFTPGPYDPARKREIVFQCTNNQVVASCALQWTARGYCHRSGLRGRRTEASSRAGPLP